jgi:hypothetical protein
MKVHGNAALGPAGRLALVQAIESGMTQKAADGIRTHDLLHGQLGPSSRPADSEHHHWQGFCSEAGSGCDLEYARICADMQRFGNFGAEVPEIDGLGLISAQGQARVSIWQVIQQKNLPDTLD